MLFMLYFALSEIMTCLPRRQTRLLNNITLTLHRIGKWDKPVFHSVDSFKFNIFKIYDGNRQMSKNKYISDKNQGDHYKTFQDIFLVVLSIVLITGCNSRNKKSAVELSASNATEQEPYQIRLWQGGGFTGLISGFTLFSNGEVTHWQRFPGQSDSILWKGTGSLAEIQKLKRQLEESGALEMKADETGNMTEGASYETKETVYRWTWKQTGSDDDIPESIRGWFKDAILFCQSLLEKN